MTLFVVDRDTDSLTEHTYLSYVLVSSYLIVLPAIYMIAFNMCNLGFFRKTLNSKLNRLYIN